MRGVRSGRAGWLASLIAMVIAVLFPVAAAQAAPPKVKIVAVTPLMSDFLTAERFNVLRVYLSSELAISGEVRLTFDQDASQRATVVVPFSTTPGQTIPVDIVAAFPNRLDVATLTAGDARVRLERGIGGNLSLPRVISNDVIAIVTVPGRDALTRGFRDLPTPDRSPMQGREYITVTPGQMPRQWIGLDAVDAVIITQDAFDLLDNSQQAALRTWLESGGEVVHIVGPAGPAWRDLLTDGPAAEFFDIGDQMQRPITAVELDAFGLPKANDVTYRMGARSIRLTPRASDMGWTNKGIARNRSSDLLVETVTSDTAAIAVGPVGLGRLTVLGFDPLAIHPLQKPDLGPRVVAAMLPQPDANQNQYGWYGSMSGRDYAQNTALQSAVDGVVRAPVFGLWSLIAVGVGITALGLLLSVFDGLYLRRRRLQHRSWLTAIGWISIASVVAYVAPALLRDGDSQVGHAVWIEAIDHGDGPALARRADILTVFSGRPQFVPMDLGVDRAWVRGVSTQYYLSNSGLLPPLVLPQSNDRRGDPGSAPPGIACPQWSLRVLAAVAPMMPTTIDGAAERVGDEWRIRVTGLPEDLQPGAGRILIGGNWAALETDGADQGPEREYYAAAAATRTTELTAPNFVAFGHTPRNELLLAMTHSGRYALLHLFGSDNSDAARPVMIGEPASMYRQLDMLLVVPILGESAAPAWSQPQAANAAAQPRRLWPAELPISTGPRTSEIPEEFLPVTIIENPGMTPPAPPTPPTPPSTPQEKPE